MTGARSKVVQQLRRAGNHAVPIGLFVNFTDPASTEIVAAAGFDFVLVDGEHAPLDRLEILNHVRAAESSGVAVLARVLEGTDAQIQGVLDLGAAGVIVPKVRTAERAREIVLASRYAPAGKRGMCPSCHDGKYDLTTFFDRMHRRNETVLAIPLIETRDGVENIEAIAKVDGIDIIFFGPGDYSADAGIDLLTELDKVRDAWRRVRDAGQAAGKAVLAPSGFGFGGADALLVGIDQMLLFQHLTAVAKSVQEQGA